MNKPQQTSKPRESSSMDTLLAGFQRNRRMGHSGWGRR